MLITPGSWKDKETRLRSVTQGNFSNDELVTEFSQKIRFQCMSIERHEMNTMVITGSNQKKRKRHNQAIGTQKRQKQENSAKRGKVRVTKS